MFACVPWLQYHVVSSTVRVLDGSATAELHSSEDGAPPFNLDVRFYRTGTARVRVTEKTDQEPRWEVSTRRCRPSTLCGA